MSLAGRRKSKANPSSSRAQHRLRAGGITIIGIVALLAIVLAAGSSYWWWSSGEDDTIDASILLHTVHRDDFELTITERGEIESFDVTEVRSLVKSNNTTGNAILRIVPEGTIVKKGDFLVELDSSALVAQVPSQKILVNDAKALEVEAKNNFDVAVIAKREYLEGTYLQERQTAESEQFVSEENLNRAKDYFAYSQKLASKGYVNENQLEADRFAVEKSKKDLDASKTKLMVMDEFTKPKMLSTLESAILIAKAKWDAAQNSLQLEEGKLRDLDDQIDKCTMAAPQDGVVKYAHMTDNRGDSQFIVDEGTIVRERQVIIKLPNADSMRVNLTVNESLVQYVQPGFATEIRPVGYGDKVLHGVVEKVNQYAEPTSWRQANVKDYKAYIHINDVSPDLRSGMTASVTIHCADVPDAIQVPVQSMFAWGPKFYCFAYSQGKFEAREVKPGPTNDKFFVIETGLKEGDQVALNPRAHVNLVSLPKLPPEEVQRAVPQPPSAERGAQTAKAGAGPGAPGAVGPGAPAAGAPGGGPGEVRQARGGRGPGGAGVPGANGPGGTANRDGDAAAQAPGDRPSGPAGPGGSGRRRPDGASGEGAPASNASAVSEKVSPKPSQGAAE